MAAVTGQNGLLCAGCLIHVDVVGSISKAFRQRSVMLSAGGLGNVAGLHGRGVDSRVSHRLVGGESERNDTTRCEVRDGYDVSRSQTQETEHQDNL